MIFIHLYYLFLQQNKQKKETKMNITEARKNYIFTTRIEIPSLTGGENDFVELREPTIEEMRLFGDDEMKNLEALKTLFPKCLIDHSFTNDDGTKSTNQDVYNLLKDSASLYTDIVGVWFKSIPFQSRLRSKES
jgi:hypothetical protein